MIGFTLDEVFEKIEMSKYTELMLRSCYSREDRKYHNLDHISCMLQHVPRDLPGVEGLLEAIVFHDLVYLPEPAPKGKNEALSASEYLLYSLRTVWEHPNPFANFELVREMIVIEAITATSRHDEDQEHLNLISKYVLDLDLCCFADREELSKASKLISEEFAPYVDRQTFIKGRVSFLNALLARKQIFYVMKEWEEISRQNLQDEIALLTSEEERGHV